MKTKTIILLISAFIIMLSGCAFNVIKMPTQAAKLAPASGPEKTFKLVESITITPPHEYQRTLKKGTVWKRIGILPQGEVYNSKDQVLTIEASHVYEAYLVVKQKMLVGFYLPVEKAFTPMDTKVELPIQQ